VPRYYFHVFDGADYIDREGTELPDWDAARTEAIRFAGEILKDEAKRVGLGENWHLQVTDETGLTLFRLDFTVTPSPAIEGSRKP